MLAIKLLELLESDLESTSTLISEMIQEVESTRLVRKMRNWKLDYESEYRSAVAESPLLVLAELKRANTFITQERKKLNRRFPELMHVLVYFKVFFEALQNTLTEEDIREIRRVIRDYDDALRRLNQSLVHPYPSHKKDEVIRLMEAEFDLVEERGDWKYKDSQLKRFFAPIQAYHNSLKDLRRNRGLFQELYELNKDRLEINQEVDENGLETNPEAVESKIKSLLVRFWKWLTSLF